MSAITRILCGEGRLAPLFSVPWHAAWALYEPHALQHTLLYRAPNTNGVLSIKRLYPKPVTGKENIKTCHGDETSTTSQVGLDFELVGNSAAGPLASALGAVGYVVVGEGRKESSDS